MKFWIAAKNSKFLVDRPGTQTKARCLIRQKHEKRIGEAWDNRDREIREIPTDRPSAGREGPATDSHPPRLITPETHRPAKRASGPDRMRHLAANRRRSFTRLGRRSPQREHRRSIPNPTALLIPQEERGTFSGSTPTLPSVRRRKGPLARQCHAWAPTAFLYAPVVGASLPVRSRLCRHYVPF